MAKKTKRVQVVVKRKKTRSRGARMTGLTKEQAYAQLLADPCNAVPRSFYPGEMGIVNRFITDFVINGTATHTAGIIAFVPGLNTVLTGSNAASNGLITLTANTGPGAGLISSSARKFRALAGCITALPSAVSYTNITGEIAVGNVAADQLGTVTAVTVDSVFQLLPKRAVLAKTQYDVKWQPGVLDHTYQTMTTAGRATSSEQGDLGMVILAYRGFPASTPISIRLTSVLEWTPFESVGIPTSNVSNTPVDHHQVVAAMSNSHPGWWHNIGNELEHIGTGILKDVGMAGRYLARQGLAKGVRGVENWLWKNTPKYVAGTAGTALLTL
nr:MAG: hypothetical protein [Narnaviridae sp.]